MKHWIQQEEQGRLSFEINISNEVVMVIDS